MRCAGWRSVLLTDERLVIPRAGIDRAKRPEGRRFGYRRLGRTPFQLALLQRLDESGKTLLGRARPKFLHPSIPTPSPLGQRHPDPRRGGPGPSAGILRGY